LPEFIATAEAIDAFASFLRHWLHTALLLPSRKSAQIDDRSTRSKRLHNAVGGSTAFKKKLMDGPTVLIEDGSVVTKMICPSLSIIQNYSQSLFGEINQTEVDLRIIYLKNDTVLNHAFCRKRVLK
jgi:hypothetical protein